MDFSLSPRAADLRDARARLHRHRDRADRGRRARRHHQRARERRRQLDPRPADQELQAKAREQGLWNLFLPARARRAVRRGLRHRRRRGPSNVDYAPLAEAMGRSFLAPLVFNCNAPDTGNMEVLLRYGTDEQRTQWLEPLLRGEIRSAFCMTEPDVASSDATNMAATAVVDGDEVVVNGSKWFSTGVGNPDCKILVFMGLTNPDADRHSRHTMVLVPARRPRREGRADAHHDGLLRRAARARRGVLRRRPRPGRQHPARRGPRVRDRPGPARPRPRPPLHARHRAGREGPRARLPPGLHAHRLRQAAGQPRRQPRAHRRRPDRHQPLPAARPARRLAARPGHVGRGDLRGQRDQGRGAAAWPSTSSTWPSSSTAAPA